MSAIPCPIRLDECPGADSPITNASSEAPDPFFYVGIGYNPYDPYNPITIDQGPKVDCDVIDWSLIDQNDADLMALIAAANCRPPPGPRPRPDPSCTADPNQPPCIDDHTFPRPPDSNIHRGNLQQFTNDTQTVSITCPNGSVFSETIVAGTFLSPFMDPAVGPAWVEYINAWIHAYLLSVVLANEVCMTIPNITERFPPTGVPPDWPAGCAWPPTDPTCWPPLIIWPDPPPGWPLDCAWPPLDATCFPPGHDWTNPRNFPHAPQTTSTLVSSWPGWLCLGSTLEPALNTYQVTGAGDWTFEISGGMEPPGTALVKVGTNTAVLQGTPLAPGFYAWSVRATNGIKSVEVADAMNVLGLITSSPGAAEVGTPYSASLQAAGGTAPYNYTASGTVPQGLTVATDGTISGTPTTTGTYDFDVTVTDAGGRFCVQPVSIEVLASPEVCPDWTTLLWDPATVGGINGGSATFTPSSAASDSFGAMSDSPSPFPFAFPGSQAVAENTGRLTYNGTGCHCNVHVVVANQVGTPPDVQTDVDIRLDGNPLAFFAPVANGPYDFAFTLPDTLGLPVAFTVTIRCDAQTGLATSAPLHVEFSGTFSNI